MNNSYNYADFIGTSITSNGEYEAQNYHQELQPASSYLQEPSTDTPIEYMLFSHHKYHIYCE
ncbi:MAG: hypothetical protein ACN4GM_13915 [Gammaproteobacteria bacterium]